jgi:hypothetical protein
MYLTPAELDEITRLRDRIAELEMIVLEREMQIQDRDEDVAILEDGLAGMLEDYRVLREAQARAL